MQRYKEEKHQHPIEQAHEKKKTKGAIDKETGTRTLAAALAQHPIEQFFIGIGIDKEANISSANASSNGTTSKAMYVNPPNENMKRIDAAAGGCPEAFPKSLKGWKADPERLEALKRIQERKPAPKIGLHSLSKDDRRSPRTVSRSPRRLRYGVDVTRSRKPL